MLGYFIIYFMNALLQFSFYPFSVFSKITHVWLWRHFLTMALLGLAMVGLAPLDY
jgi:hypothetical protein